MPSGPMPAHPLIKVGGLIAVLYGTNKVYQSRKLKRQEWDPAHQPPDMGMHPYPIPPLHPGIQPPSAFSPGNCAGIGVNPNEKEDNNSGSPPAMACGCPCHRFHPPCEGGVSGSLGFAPPYMYQPYHHPSLYGSHPGYYPHPPSPCGWDAQWRMLHGDEAFGCEREERRHHRHRHHRRDGEDKSKQREFRESATAVKSEEMVVPPTASE